MSDEINIPNDQEKVDVRALIDDARTRIPELVEQIVGIVSAVDPIELISQLCILYQTHRADEMPDRDEHAMWQIRIEWLTSLVLFRRLQTPAVPAVIDAGVLGPLEATLKEYFDAVAITLADKDVSLTDAQDTLRASIQREALLVRGEGFTHEIKALAVGLYSPHDEWCLANIGLTIGDTFTVAEGVTNLLLGEIRGARETSRRIEEAVRVNPRAALEVEGLPLSVRENLAEVLPEPEMAEEFAHFISSAWLFSNTKQIVGFTLPKLQAKVAATVAPERVVAFLEFMSVPADAIDADPNPLVLSPLAFHPLLARDDHFYLFVPALLYIGIYYAFHRRLYSDHKQPYDDARADWLESTAIETFRGLLPGAEAAWDVAYGPKRARLQADGIVVYDNKLILIECKWKSPTLVALQGDVPAAIKDINKAISDALSQAQRTRAYIRDHGTADFHEKRTDRHIQVRAADIEEVFLVTLVGSGAWAAIAANLQELTPLGLFPDGEFPWAISVHDLLVVRNCLELPSQLFDYLRRRYEFQQDGRFKLHDEWDYIGTYLRGALDPSDPRYPAKDQIDRIALFGMDEELQDHYYSLNTPGPVAPKPRREVPPRILELLNGIERGRGRGRTDAICAVLGWPDDGLHEMVEMLEQARKKAVWDGKAHSVSAKHPWKASGITLCYGHKDRRAIRKLLLSASEGARETYNIREWVGFGIDLATPDDPLMVYYPREGRVSLAGTPLGPADYD